MTNQAGKGSKRRQRDNRFCTAEQYAENYERAFSKSRLPKPGRVRTTVFKDGEPMSGPMLILDEDGMRIEYDA